MRKSPTLRFRSIAALSRNQAGSALVEAAFALPLLISLLFGILVYGSWFMTAHSLQQAANDAARAAVAGLDAAERRALVEQSIAASRTAFPAPAAQTISIGTQESGGYYRVTLSYDLNNAPIFAATPIPLSNTTLQRSAVIRIAMP
ncbi:MAG: pilus assembly protein TadE [Sphingobium sp.]|uniref:Pilus assembly protein TadE n=1 Tax=Sphingobium xenophagum TaxID=121428 RepID=A0A249MUZ3_SPHXE|nr:MULTISPECIES: TadE/TadG family type IV pilus assembly protein [Sphingobium]MBU0659480.1 pilus assembly protein [Alphaproteobacteria bacterium]ASY45193.1 pilus assembly protein TadE [Sphingobium xenophagum]MBA4755790.1 pilus assembly protein [Sphingobium sp.]MBU0776493.1 pilus assembly protein [Alphaproteobacteria bacterium]MBU1795136.1 pilus assembly protein [Alphaproteobacteria bacterium]